MPDHPTEAYIREQIALAERECHLCGTGNPHADQALAAREAVPVLGRALLEARRLIGRRVSNCAKWLDATRADDGCACSLCNEDRAFLADPPPAETEGTR